MPLRDTVDNFVNNRHARWLADITFVTIALASGAAAYYIFA